MKIFFTCSTTDIKKYKDNYHQIRDSILNLHHSITRDWVDYSIRLADKRKKDIATSTIYQEVMSAILTADLVIADTTVRSMSVGHQITFALQKKKPVLLLQHTNGEKHLNDLFINGAKSPLLLIKGYRTKDEIPAIIKNFIQRYESNSKTRFNLALNNSQDSYIEWASFTYKKSKTEIIQDAINEKMENDKAFDKYLES